MKRWLLIATISLVGLLLPNLVLAAEQPPNSGAVPVFTNISSAHDISSKVQTTTNGAGFPGISTAQKVAGVVNYPIGTVSATNTRKFGNQVYLTPASNLTVTPSSGSFIVPNSPDDSTFNQVGSFWINTYIDNGGNLYESGSNDLQLNGGNLYFWGKPLNQPIDATGNGLYSSILVNNEMLTNTNQYGLWGITPSTTTNNDSVVPTGVGYIQKNITLGNKVELRSSSQPRVEEMYSGYQSMPMLILKLQPKITLINVKDMTVSGIGTQVGDTITITQGGKTTTTTVYSNGSDNKGLWLQKLPDPDNYHAPITVTETDKYGDLSGSDTFQTPTAQLKVSNQAGKSIISGTGFPGATLYLLQGEYGDAADVGSTTVNPDGTWQLQVNDDNQALVQPGLQYFVFEETNEEDYRVAFNLPALLPPITFTDTVAPINFGVQNLASLTAGQLITANWQPTLANYVYGSQFTITANLIDGVMGMTNPNSTVVIPLMVNGQRLGAEPVSVYDATKDDPNQAAIVPNDDGSQVGVNISSLKAQVPNLYSLKKDVPYTASVNVTLSNVPTGN